MKIFVTGATGFIGRAFLNRISETSAIGVIAHARPTSPRVKRLAALHRNVSWIYADSFAEVQPSEFENVDVLVHLAAAGVSPQKSTWETLFRVNVNDTIKLWENAAIGGVAHFLVIGSCFEYGKSGEEFARIPPSAPLEPLTPYGASKAAASLAAIAFSRDKKVCLDVARPFHVYGSGQNEANFFPSLCKAAASGEDFPMTMGAQLRDFICVDELANQLLNICREPFANSSGTRIRNLGSGQPQSLREFAEVWWSKLEAKGELKVGELAYRETEIMSFLPELNETYLI